MFTSHRKTFLYKQLKCTPILNNQKVKFTSNKQDVGIPINEFPPVRDKRSLIIKSPPKVNDLVDISTNDIPLMVPEEYKSSLDPKGWWVVEKSVGIRSFFDGKGYMYDSHGKLLPIPFSFIRTLPAIPLDGILHSKSGKLEKILDTLLDKSENSCEEVQYQVHDAPSQHVMPFEERMKFLRDTLASDFSSLQFPKVIQCENANHLKELYENSIKKGFQGIAMRTPKSFYYQLDSYYQLQKETTDEACVTEIIGDTLKCVNKNEAQFIVSGKIKPSIKVNDVITFRCTSFIEDIPQDPTFLHSRPDLQVGDILNHQKFPYRVSFGRQRGIPKCRGCKKDLRDRNELRITVNAMFYPPGVGPYPGKVAFCLNESCLTQALDEDSQKRGLKLDYPPFKGKLGVSKLVKEKGGSLPVLKQFQFVDVG